MPTQKRLIAAAFSFIQRTRRPSPRRASNRQQRIAAGAQPWPPISAFGIMQRRDIEANGGISFMQDGNTAAPANRKFPVRDLACALGLSILFPYFRAFFLSIVKSADVHSAAAFEGSFCAFAVVFALCAAAVLAAGPRLVRMATNLATSAGGLHHAARGVRQHGAHPQPLRVRENRRALPPGNHRTGPHHQGRARRRGSDHAVRSRAPKSGVARRAVFPAACPRP